MTLIDANDTQLYYEKRGSGPSVVFVAGATRDASHFAEVAELLADEFTTIVYDRRGNSRSPRPENWTATSLDEQSDDVAALLDATGCAPAVAVGTSAGALIVGNLMLTRPDVLRGAILHEPPLFWTSAESEAALAHIGQLIGEGFAAGGPDAALNNFFPFAMGEAGFAAIPDEHYARFRQNAEVFLTIESPAFAWRPDSDELRRVPVPAVVMAGVEEPTALHRAYLVEGSHWLADALGAPYRQVVDGHGPYYSSPAAFADQLRETLRELP